MAGGVVWRAAARSLRKGTMRFMEQPRVVTALRAAAGVVESETSCYHHRASMWSSVSRSASTARDSAPQDGGLLRVLKSEIQHEKDDYEPPSTLARGPPQPFTIEDKPGKLEVTLRRAYGEEDIEVTCIFEPGMAPEEEGEDEYHDEDSEIPDQNVVHLTVSVTKRGEQPVLEFGCVVDKSNFSIGSVRYLEGKESKAEPVFDGPDFASLDENLQNQFKKFLEARGIDGNLADYLSDLMEDKEKREYSRWLQNIEAFVKK
ncbi:unnamed protein product [Sphagnum troendelagicum]